MALFDGDLVTVTTPDGRQVQMPSDLAASFPALSPVASPLLGTAPQPDVALPTPDPGVAPVPVPPPQGGPVTSPAQVPDAGPTVAPRQAPVTEPGPEQGTQQVAQPPPPRAPTNAELAKNGPGQTLLAQNTAIDKQQAAINKTAEIQADEATKEGAVMAARDAKTQQILEERAKAAAANQAELERRIGERDRLANQIANTRIDRSVDHPIWAAIGLVLSTIGTALQKRPGEKWDDPAYNVLMQQIDRKVAGQVQDLELKRQSLSQMNVGITDQRQMGMDKLAEIDVRRDAAIQQAKQMVETMAKQVESPLAKSRALELSAKLDEERATMRGTAAQRAQDQINHERQMAQAAQFHKESMDIERTKMAIDERDKVAAIAEKMLDKQTAAKDKQAKDLAERSVGDPRTGFAMMSQAGQQKMQQADQLEAQARQQQDLQQAAKMRQYAAQLRDSARQNDTELAPDKKTADELTNQATASQQIVDRIGDVIDKLKAGPGVVNREAWASITTDLGNVAGMYQQAIKERVSPKAFDQTMKHILAFDPDSWFDRAASKDKAIESLKTLKGIVKSNMDAAFKGAKMRTSWVPLSKDEGNVTTFNADDKTAGEIGQDRSLGYLNLSRYTGGQEQAQQEAEESAQARPGSESGLSPNATTHLKALAARADVAGDAERSRIVQALANPITAGLQEGGRSSLAYGMLDVLSSANPGLYKEVVAMLPDDEQKRIAASDAIKRPANIPASMLTPSTYDPDRAAAKYAASPEGRAAYEQEGRDIEARRLDAKAVLERQQRRYEEQRARAAGGGR